MSEEIAGADALMTELTHLRQQVKALSHQIGEQNTTIGYQDAKLRRIEADAGWLRGLVQRAIRHLDEYGEIGTPIAAMAEDLAVKLGKTGDAGASLLAELNAARAVVECARTWIDWPAMNQALAAYDEARKARGE